MTFASADLEREAKAYVAHRRTAPEGTWNQPPVFVTDADVNVLLARRGLIFCGWLSKDRIEVEPL